MVRMLGILFGGAFLFGGVLGFVPGVTSDGMYFGIFMVNTPHNVLHIASGTIFLTSSTAGATPARLWFHFFGIFYAAIAVMGFMVDDGMILNLISNNRNDSWGHAALAAIMLLIGFTVPKQTATAEQFGVR